MMNKALQRLADQQDLVGLISHYAHAVDARDVEAIVACFTEDTHVEFDGGAEVVDGREALATFFAHALVRPRMGQTGASTHLMSNILVAIEGDEAHVETQAVAYLASDSSSVVVTRGLRYSDDCVRRGDGWLIHRRVHRSLWQSEAPGGPLR